MSIETQEILERALQLPAVDKAYLVDELLTSLDKPDEAIDAVWRQEVEGRLKAYHAGNLHAVALAQVVAQYRQEWTSDFLTSHQERLMMRSSMTMRNPQVEAPARPSLPLPGAAER